MGYAGLDRVRFGSGIKARMEKQMEMKLKLTWKLGLKAVDRVLTAERTSSPKHPYILVVCTVPHSMYIYIVTH